MCVHVSGLLLILRVANENVLWINYCLSIDHVYSMYLNLQEFTVIWGPTYGALYMYSWSSSYCTGIDFGTKKF